MPLPPHDPATFREAFACLGSSFVSAEGADVDEAFDAAVSAAYNDPQIDAAFTSADPGAVVAREGLHSLDQAIAAAAAWVRQVEPGTEEVAAFAVVGRSAHTRVTRRARVEGVDFEVDGSAAAPWTSLETSLAEAVAAAEAGPGDGESVERVTVTRRARYKPVAEMFKGKMAAQFVVLHGDRVVSKGHPTAGVARRAASDLIKAMPAEDHSAVRLEVFKLSGREEGRPLGQVVRERVRQVLTLKVVYAAAKQAAKPPKVVGWVFVTAPQHTD